MRAVLPTIAAFAAASLQAAAAEEPRPMAAMKRTIAVAGLGEIYRTPDMAQLVLGVEAEGATAAEALRKNTAQMDATIKALRDAGVDKKDIQTSNLHVGARYDYSRENAPPRIIGYQATNTVSVKLRDLDKAGAVIDKAVGVGANRLDSIAFGFADPKPVLDAARRAAVLDARSRAELYAAAAGVQLGPVLSISDSYTPGPGPVPALQRMEMDAAASKAAPVMPGESLTIATVAVVYGIE
jgi:hypothetical protein